MARNAATDQPTPDYKDWTWVLDSSCPQCGFDATQVNRDDLGARCRANAAAWRAVLQRGEMVKRRPPVADGETPLWSALEYAAHVRDVYELVGDRLKLMLKKSGPTFKDWDQNRAAIKGKYSEQDPDKVAYKLAFNAGKVADTYDRLSAEEWSRTGLRSDGASFTVESFGKYILHDVEHHLWDAQQGFDTLTGS